MKLWFTSKHGKVVLNEKTILCNTTSNKNHIDIEALSMVNTRVTVIEKTKFANYTVKVQDVSLNIVVNARPQFLTGRQLSRHTRGPKRVCDGDTELSRSEDTQRERVLCDDNSCRYSGSSCSFWMVPPWLVLYNHSVCVSRLDHWLTVLCRIWWSSGCRLDRQVLDSGKWKNVAFLLNIHLWYLSFLTLISPVYTH